MLQAGGVNELLSKALLYSLLNRIKVRAAVHDSADGAAALQGSFAAKALR